MTSFMKHLKVFDWLNRHQMDMEKTVEGSRDESHCPPATKKAAFKRDIQPTLSDDEVNAFASMIDGKLQPMVPPGESVVVIGAGLAGLAAARELKQAGLDVVVLEASQKAGGRCSTVKGHPFAPGIISEAGGMRFPSHHHVLMKYVSLFGLKKVPFANMKDKNGLIFFNGAKQYVQDELNDKNSLLSRVLAKWEESIMPLREEWEEKQDWESIINRFSDTSLLDFLTNSGWSADLIEGFGKFGIGTGPLQSMFGISFIEVLRVSLKRYEAQNFTLQGGMESLVEAFLSDQEAPLEKHIRYGSKALSIDKKPDGSFLVVYRREDSDSDILLPCDFCVLAVPLTSVSRITFSPPLPERLQKAVRNSHYVRSTKIILQTRSPFWLKHGVNGSLISDLCIKNTYFCPPSPNTEKGVIYASYTWEDDAEFFFSLSDQQKIHVAVEELSKVFPEMKTEYECGYAVEWESAFCLLKPGQFEHSDALREQVFPNFFLAGEHCSVEHGYFEGALESGLRAAANIFQSCDKTFRVKFEAALNPRCVHLENKNNGAFSSCFDVLVKRCKRCHMQYRLLKNMACGDNKPVNIIRSKHETESFPSLPIPLLSFDHYTLVCEDAKKVAEFHIKELGYKFLRTLNVNTGTVEKGQVDMLNYLLSPPENPNVLLVITEGLNEETIFQKYLKIYGPGIHHIAFLVEDIDQAFQALKAAGIKTTADHVTVDKVQGLQQLFIDSGIEGFFIELVGRPETSPESYELSDENVVDLAQSMAQYVQDETGTYSKTRRDTETPRDTEMEGGALKAEQDDVYTLGRMKSVGINVPEPEAVAAFFQKVFSLSLKREDARICLVSDSSPNDIYLYLQQSQTVREERELTVAFETSLVDATAVTQTTPRRLSARHTTYVVEISSPVEKK